MLVVSLSAKRLDTQQVNARLLYYEVLSRANPSLGLEIESQKTFNDRPFLRWRQRFLAYLSFPNHVIVHAGILGAAMRKDIRHDELKRDVIPGTGLKNWSRIQTGGGRRLVGIRFSRHLVWAGRD
jgi:hypothetical protein